METKLMQVNEELLKELVNALEVSITFVRGKNEEFTLVQKALANGREKLKEFNPKNNQA